VYIYIHIIGAQKTPKSKTKEEVGKRKREKRNYVDDTDSYDNEDNLPCSFFCVCLWTLFLLCFVLAKRKQEQKSCVDDGFGVDLDNEPCCCFIDFFGFLV